MRSYFQFSVRPILAAFLWSVLSLSGTGVTVAHAQNDQSEVQEVDRVIAVVNNEVITAHELNAEIAAVRARAGAGLPPPDQLEQRVLETIILDRAQLQAARERGIVVDEPEIDRALEGIARDNRLSVTELRDRLRADGIGYDEFRKDIRRQIIEGRLREAAVESSIRVSDADIDAWLAEQAGKTKQAMQMEVAQIMLPIPESATSEVIAEKQKLADDLLARARGGEDFARLAVEFSGMPGAAENGGSMGWRTVEELPRLFVDAVVSLEPGQIAPAVRSPAGLHLLKLLDRRGGIDDLDKAVTQTKVRHILIRPSASLTEDEIRRRLESIRERLVSGQVQFDAMARQYSVDGSAANGGELGWVYAGDTVPEFERAMDALKPGELSQPTRTQFGFHLIQVMERRQDTASPERRRQAARRALMKSRSDAAWREWLDELRARTYVEKRLEQ